MYYTVLYCNCTVLYIIVLYCTLLYIIVLYCTVLYCSILYCTVLYCTLLYIIVLYYTVLYFPVICTILYCTVLYCTVLYCTVLYIIVLYCTVLYCNILYFPVICTILYCTVLYCNILYFPVICTILYCLYCIVREIDTLASIANTQTHAAYAAFTHGLSSKWVYFARTIPDISALLKPLENAIRTRFLTFLTGQNALSDDMRTLLSLPVRLGGLGIINPFLTSDYHFSSSVMITDPLVSLIRLQFFLHILLQP